MNNSYLSAANDRPYHAVSESIVTPEFFFVNFDRIFCHFWHFLWQKNVQFLIMPETDIFLFWPTFTVWPNILQIGTATRFKRRPVGDIKHQLRLKLLLNWISGARKWQKFSSIFGTRKWHNTSISGTWNCKIWESGTIP